jgi:predicted ATPase
LKALTKGKKPIYYGAKTVESLVAHYKESMKIAEHITIRNFFTVKAFDWDIKEFNILTGGMGTGKSICVKLLCFLERVLHNTIFLAPFDKSILTKEGFFKQTAEDFVRVFHCGSYDFSKTEIDYQYSSNGSLFDLHAQWDAYEHALVWSSEYISEHVEKWRQFWTKDDAPNTPSLVRYQIYEEVAHDFGGAFPVGTMFIPALRAVATATSNTDFSDVFLSGFIKELKQYVHHLKNISSDMMNKILNVKDIRYDEEKGMRITLPDGSEISPLELSSGQQELLYLLPLIRHLNETRFNFSGGTTAVFIEEPSAHLFPKEQKETLEFITAVFRGLKKTGIQRARFFITTHSPYILNVMNIMINRGILKAYSKEWDEQESRYFQDREVSAYAIDYDGIVTSMIPEGESLLYPDKIEEIAQVITDEANEVEDALAEINAGAV